MRSEVQSAVFRTYFSMSSQRHENCTDRSLECSNKQSVVTGGYCQNLVFTLCLTDKISQLLLRAVSFKEALPCVSDLTIVVKAAHSVSLLDVLRGEAKQRILYQMVLLLVEAVKVQDVPGHWHPWARVGL